MPFGKDDCKALPVCASRLIGLQFERTEIVGLEKEIKTEERRWEREICVRCLLTPCLAGLCLDSYSSQFQRLRQIGVWRERLQRIRMLEQPHRFECLRNGNFGQLSASARWFVPTFPEKIGHLKQNSPSTNSQDKPSLGYLQSNSAQKNHS